MVALESVKELEKNFVLCLLARNHVRVLSCIVNTLNVSDIDDTATVLVQDSKSLHSQGFSELVHLTTDTSQELLIVNCAVTITVELSQDNFDLVRSETDS